MYFSTNVTSIFSSYFNFTINSFIKDSTHERWQKKYKVIKLLFDEEYFSGFTGGTRDVML